MPSRGSNAKQEAIAKKKKVRLAHLSVGDGVAVALTAVRASTVPLHKAIRRSKKAGKPPDPHVFNAAVTKVLSRKKGSLYAAFVTAVDHKKVFHAEQFALGVKRLGIPDEVAEAIEQLGYPQFAHKINVYVAWYWADIVYNELKNVKKDTSTPISRALKFFEDLQKTDIDGLIEDRLSGAIPSSPRANMALAQANFTPSPSMRPYFDRTFRTLSASQYIDAKRIDKSSSFDAVFETFYQHLLANQQSLQQIKPSYRGVPLDASKLQRIFRDSNLKRNLSYAFSYAYEPSVRVIRISKLYQGFESFGTHRILHRAIKAQTGKDVEDSATNDILTSVIALFAMYMQDSKGQMIPLIANKR
ncbi:MAG: hypothetical protein DRR06_14905 [Gammaproteobacteria bacterium]|nr:MAG: hypothetical protein DRR06_14905 [Gammaproteobacteria bacterium]